MAMLLRCDARQAYEARRGSGAPRLGGGAGGRSGGATSGSQNTRQPSQRSITRRCSSSPPRRASRARAKAARTHARSALHACSRSPIRARQKAGCPQTSAVRGRVRTPRTLGRLKASEQAKWQRGEVSHDPPKSHHRAWCFCFGVRHGGGKGIEARQAGRQASKQAGSYRRHAAPPPAPSPSPALCFASRLNGTNGRGGRWQPWGSG